MRDDSGGVAVTVKLGRPSGRIGFEKRYLPGVRVDRFNWERSFESATPVHTGAQGLIFAPLEILHAYPRLGIDQFFLEAYRRKAADVELWLTTTTYTHPGTLRAAEIKYKIGALRNKIYYDLYKASLQIENFKSSPQILAQSKECISGRELYKLLR
jgi:hypothetical protein